MYKPLSANRYRCLLTALLFFGFLVPSKPSQVQQKDTLSAAVEISEHESLVRGERLFHGLVYTENKEMNCVRCHNLKFSDTINWNPDAVEISLKYLDRSSEDLKRVLINPPGLKMSQVHAGFKLSDDEIAMLKGYMDTVPAKGLQGKKPTITNLLFFIFVSILFLFSLTDLVVTRKLKRQWINLAVLTLTSVYITVVLVVNAIHIGRSPAYSPDQPVKFSHAVHAGQNQTECIFCHSYAPVSKVSGIPSTNVCMNCHLIVRTGTRTGSFEIAKVISAFEKRQGIEWIQVHNLPDHAYYNHSQHVNAGGIDCRVCHGEVEKMDRIVKVSDLSMGWCVNCHRERKVNFTGNKFYSHYAILNEEMRKGQVDSVTVNMQGGNECMRCHY